MKQYIIKLIISLVGIGIFFSCVPIKIEIVHSFDCDLYRKELKVNVHHKADELHIKHQGGIGQHNGW